MNLSDILEEISVGYNKTDPKSIKLQKYVSIVKEALEVEGAILEAKQLSFLSLGNDLEGGNVFLQGSYSCSTAIKHKLYDVDADIGFLASEELDLGARQRIFNTILAKFGNVFNCELRKPCISIDFEDGYKIDLTIYSVDEKSNVYFHNSIGGEEIKTKADPKGFVSYLKGYFKLNKYRDIIRLAKHFIKTVTEILEIEGTDKIPSVSLSIFASKNYAKLENLDSDDLMSKLLLEFLTDFGQYVKLNQINGPDMIEYYVTNTFYKIKNIDNVSKVIDTVVALLKEKNYSQLVEHNVYEAIRLKNKVDLTSPLLGTMGNGQN